MRADCFWTDPMCYVCADEENLFLGKSSDVFVILS